MLEIKGFVETSFVDWPGKLCSVLFLPQCNFRCPYCHNHPLILHPDRYPSIPLEAILERLRTFRGWIDGICITGGEPTLHHDLSVFVRKLKNDGFLVKLDTNGSNPQILENLVKKREIDFVSMDVKAPLDPFSYRRATGIFIDLDLIQRSIDLLKREEVEYEFRMTVVPGFHSEEDIKRVGKELQAGRRFVLQNFNPENPLDPSLRHISPYDPNVLKRIEREVQGMTRWPTERL
ncbi:MAG: anaerobic ribonucleoside-triphosphate reductase activating protein [Thermodesulfobacteriota bacterium]